MKRVLLVVPFNYGTIGLCSLNLFKAFSRRSDVRVKCVVIHKSQKGYSEFEKCENCSTMEASLFNKCCVGIKQIIWLHNIKNEFKPDITISTLFGCSTINVISGGCEMKIGVFHAPHKQVRSRGIFYYWLTLLQYFFIFPRLDKLFCVSEEVKNSIVTSFKSIDASKVKVVYNIHDIDNIREKSKEPLDAEYASLFDNPTIFYCGRLDENKAPIRLIDAFAKADKPQNTQLVIMGKDYEHQWSRLSRRIEKYGISKNVHYIGANNNPYKFMARSSVICSCSYSEGLPGVIIESLLLGKPVVSTNSSRGVWEIFSIPEKYNKNMDGILLTNCGIITSNLAHDNSRLYETDICNLAKALSNVLYNKIKDIHFAFEDNVSDLSLSHYLDD